MVIELTGTALSVIGAAIAVGASGIASAIGAGITGSTGATSIAENPKRFSTALLFQALPQTQGIYGFLIAILILLGAGVIGAPKEVTFAQGLAAVGAGLAVGIAGVSAIGQGVAASSGLAASAEDKKLLGKSLLFSVLPETQALYGFLIAILLLVGSGFMGASNALFSESMGWAAIGSGLAVGLAAISAIGQGIAASAGINSILEKPKFFGKSILFAVLPETQALYGFIVAILILIGFKILGTPEGVIPFSVALFAIAAGLSVGLAAISAIGQGIAAAAGATTTAENPKVFGKAILFSVLPETQALYGFLIAILILVGGGILGSAKLGITTPAGIIAIGASLSVGLAAISAIGQGIAAAHGVNAVSKKPSMFGKSLVFSVLPETQALYGFLIAILLLVGAGIIGTIKSGLTLSTSLVAIGASLAVGLAAISALGQGQAASAGINAVSKKPSMFGKSLVFSVLPETQALYGFLIAILLLVGSGLIGAVSAGLNLATGLIAVGAGLAVGLAAISALGQGQAAATSIAAVTEKPNTFGKSLLFSVLPETQALYGFLIAILLLVGGGLIGSTKTGLVTAAGLIAIGAGLAVGFAAISAIGQGIAASAGINAVSKKPSMFGKSLVFSVLPETQALYGFLIAILMLVGGGLIGAVNNGLNIGVGLVAIGAGLATGIAAISAIGQGMTAASSIAAVTEKPSAFGKSLLFSVLPETQALYGFLIAILLLIGGGIIGGVQAGVTTPLGIIAIGSSLAVGLAAVSAIGQGIAASSGASATAENSKVFGKSILFSVLPETQALYGFLIAILLLVGSGLVGGIKQGVTTPMGYVALASGIAVGLAAISAVGQGIAASAGINSILRNTKVFGKSILFAVLPETQALYGFLIAILLLVGGGLLGTFKVGLTVPLGLVAIGAGIAVGLAAISAIGQGIVAGTSALGSTENPKVFGKSILFAVLPETQALYGFLVSILLLIGGGLLGTFKADVNISIGLIAIGAGLAVGIAAISALGQSIPASSGSGAILEKNDMFGRSLLFSVLPETQALYGTIIGILIITGVGLLGTIKAGITPTQGIGGIAAGLTIGFAAISSMGQGVVASSSIAASMRDKKSMGKSLVLSVMPETYAIFGLLISILILLGLKII